MSVDIHNHIKEIRSLIDKSINGKTIRLIKYNENITISNNKTILD